MQQKKGTNGMGEKLKEKIRELLVEIDQLEISEVEIKNRRLLLIDMVKDLDEILTSQED